MNFRNSKIKIMIVAGFAALCVVIVSIAISIVMDTRNRQEQRLQRKVMKPMPSDNMGSIKSQRGNIPKQGELVLENAYFNGVVAPFSAYVSEKFGLFVPVDKIIKALGGKYDYYNSDDLFKSEVDGNQLLLKLGSNSFSYGNSVIDLKMAPITQDDNILVPSEMLANLGIQYQLQQSQYEEERKEVFLYRDVNYLKQGFPGFKKVVMFSGKLGVSTLTEDESKEIKDIKTDTTRISRQGKLFVEGINQAYFIDPLSVKSITLNLSDKGEFEWTFDGKHLYFVGRADKKSYLISAKDGAIKELGDYGQRLAKYPIMNSFKGRVTLYSSSDDNGIKRITLADSSFQTFYTFLEKEGKGVLEGESFYSPDGKKLIIQDKNRRCYVMNSSGTDIVSFALGSRVSWINNFAISVKTGDQEFLYTRSGKFSQPYEGDFQYLGSSSNQSVYYARNNKIYYENAGHTKFIADVGFVADRIYAGENKDIVFVVPRMGQSDVTMLSGNQRVELCKKSSLVTGVDALIGEGKIKDLVQYSPDMGQVAFVQKENNGVEVKVVDSKSLHTRSFILSVQNAENFQSEVTNFCWLNNHRLMLMTKTQMFVVSTDTGDIFYSGDHRAGNNVGILH